MCFRNSDVHNGNAFRQCLPIEEFSLTSEQVNLSVKRCELWKHFTVFNLTRNLRLDPRFEYFAKWQLDVGDGVNIVDGTETREALLDEILFHGCLIEEIYGELLRPHSSLRGPRLINYLKGRCILAVLNDVCDWYNQAIVDRLPGTIMISKSIDEIVANSNTDHHRYTSEHLNSVDVAGFLPHQLKLKKNCVVLMLRNLNVKQGLVNGMHFEALWVVGVCVTHGL